MSSIGALSAASLRVQRSTQEVLDRRSRLAYLIKMIREMKLTSIEGQYYLFPIPVIKERKYLILCSSEVEGALILEAIRAKRIEHPDFISEDFVFLTFHSDKQTKIFHLNPRIKL